jgi:hypothetical protein
MQIEAATDKNLVIAGNGTLEAAKQLGWTTINVIRTKLTGTDLTAFGVADNRSSDLAEWEENLGDMLEVKAPGKKRGAKEDG